MVHDDGHETRNCSKSSSRSSKSSFFKLFAKFADFLKNSWYRNFDKGPKLGTKKKKNRNFVSFRNVEISYNLIPTSPEEARE